MAPYLSTLVGFPLQFYYYPKLQDSFNYRFS